MKYYSWAATAALIGASVLSTACDRRDNAAAPPTPQTSPSTGGSTTGGSTTAPSSGMGSTTPGDAASVPGMGASR